MSVLDWEVEGTMAKAQRDALANALYESGNNVSKAASRLRIGRSTLYRLMRRYGVAVPAKPTAKSVARSAGGGELAGSEVINGEAVVFDGVNYLLIKR